MFGTIWIKLVIAGALVAGGFYGGLRWQAGPLEKARGDLAVAARLAAMEQAARRELTAQCEARDAASSDAQTRRDAVQRAVDNAIREANDAAASGDDGLGALLDRLRGNDTTRP